MSTPLPDGFGIVLDPQVKRLDETTLLGGSPARAMRLSAAGVHALAELSAGPVRSRAAGLLARRLTDAGLAQPRPPASHGRLDVTVLVPVRDRPELLARCLSALGNSHPVLVVDDGSQDPKAIEKVAADHGVSVLRRCVNGGPGAARNSGLAQISSEFVALVDSDCVPAPGWIEQLGGHLADPLVAAVAPRIVAIPGCVASGTAARYAASCSSLDLGSRAARVVPGTRVAYVPTAALLARRSALTAVAHGADVFDPALRVGEDVDLVWRLHRAGYRLRYEPAVQVRHHEPQTWPALLGRRFSYGGSAAPLAHRHPDFIAPLVVHPWASLAVVGLLARRPALAAAGFAGAVSTTIGRLRRAKLPSASAIPAALTATRLTWLGAGRYGTQFAAPVLVAALIVPGRTRGGRRRRSAAAALLFGPPLTTWFARGPSLDPARFTIAAIADDIAYGAGVWAGAARARTTVPLRPALAGRNRSTDHRSVRPTEESR